VLPNHNAFIVDTSAGLPDIGDVRIRRQAPQRESISRFGHVVQNYPSCRVKGPSAVERSEQSRRSIDGTKFQSKRIDLDWRIGAALYDNLSVQRATGRNRNRKARYVLLPHINGRAAREVTANGLIQV
jgi:hypothetical protein